MPKPNMFIVHVSDAAKSAAFYSDLFDMSPDFETPRFVAFDLGGGVQLALWSGADPQVPSAPSGELCLCLPGGADQIDRHHREWARKGVRTVQGPRDEVFGRTFVVADLDGNLIRVAPVD